MVITMTEQELMGYWRWVPGVLVPPCTCSDNDEGVYPGCYKHSRETAEKRDQDEEA